MTTRHCRWRNPRFPRPKKSDLTSFCRSAARLSGLPVDFDWGLDLHFVGDAEMIRSNAELVGHSGTTDVITFSYFDDPESLFPGEVAVELIVNPDAAFREGARRGHGYSFELALYVVHGLLHASGEDDLDPVRRRRMRRREREVMAALRTEFDLVRIFSPAE